MFYPLNQEDTVFLHQRKGFISKYRQNRQRPFTPLWPYLRLSSPPDMTTYYCHSSKASQDSWEKTWLSLWRDSLEVREEGV